ncbi:Large tegument protein [Collimonas arenae]|uniref:Large tegument protein n=2 Tax=Collimonas arenae TaxID=279058 RepID=A0A0A1F7D3_9BURK|nr:Large tegument protein [Collimonas arenae]
MIRDSQEPSDWRDGVICGEIADTRKLPRPRPVGSRARTTLFIGIILAATSFANQTSAANIPEIAGTANQNNAISPAPAKQTEEPKRQWAFDTSNGCQVWSAEPIGSDMTVRWSGRCENNLAQGPGTVRWLRNNKQVVELSGTMDQGKMRGHTTGVEEPGNRFDGMFIDSLPEGLGRASFADGSTYDGQWHRGHQLGYGIMTFPPAHPQYQEMLKDGKGSKAENGIYVLRGWWEGKTFITPCNSEEECEKAVVAIMKLDQGAAKANAATQTAPADVSAPAPVAATPVVAPETPATEPASALPVTIPAAAPENVTPATSATPVAPATESTVVQPLPIPAEPSVQPASAMPAVAKPEAEPAASPAVAPIVTTPVPELPAVGPASVPIAPVPAMPVAEPAATPATEPVPATPVTSPASEPAVPTTPMTEPATAPEMPTPAPQATDAALGAIKPISISDGSS